MCRLEVFLESPQLDCPYLASPYARLYTTFQKTGSLNLPKTPQRVKHRNEGFLGARLVITTHHHSPATEGKFRACQAVHTSRFTSPLPILRQMVGVCLHACLQTRRVRLAQLVQELDKASTERPSSQS